MTWTKQRRGIEAGASKYHWIRIFLSEQTKRAADRTGSNERGTTDSAVS
jgi:hypothetical protein